MSDNDGPHGFLYDSCECDSCREIAALRAEIAALKADRANVGVDWRAFRANSMNLGPVHRLNAYFAEEAGDD